MKNEKSLSGREIVDKIEIQLGNEWIPTPGAIYKTLSSLQEEGYILETTKDQHLKDQRIRTYTISDKGKAIIPEISTRFTKVLMFMNDCCPGCCDKVVVLNKENTSDVCD